MLALAPQPRTQQPPAKTWRNFYRIYRVLDLWRLGTVFPGIHAGPNAFPTQEIAERHAANFITAINPPGRTFMEFAGAYPEGDAAN
jgi:hypothetical protein